MHPSKLPPIRESAKKYLVMEIPRKMGNSDKQKAFRSRYFCWHHEDYGKCILGWREYMHARYVHSSFLNINGMFTRSNDLWFRKFEKGLRARSFNSWSKTDGKLHASWQNQAKDIDKSRHFWWRSDWWTMDGFWRMHLSVCTMINQNHRWWCCMEWLN